MKKVLVAVIIAIAISGCGKKAASSQKPVASCQSPVASNQTSDLRPQGIVENPKVSDGNFPVELAGTWVADVEAEKVHWEIMFKCDGSIESFKNYWNVLIKIEDGGTTEEGQGGAYAMYIPGPYRVTFDQATRELYVEVTLENYFIHLPIGDAEGRTRDQLRGIVSEDGKTWTAQWLNYAELYGAENPDPNKLEAKEVVFQHKAEVSQ